MILTKYVSRGCKCKFDGRKSTSDQKWINNNKCWIWNPATCSCENGKHLASIIDDSMITCDEIVEETKIAQTNFNKKKQPVKHKIFIFNLHI